MQQQSRAEIPLISSGEEFDALFVGFFEQRPDKSKQVSFDSLGKKFSLPKYQFMMRGLRWMAANLLLWDQCHVVLPEQLPQIKGYLPPPA